MTRPHVVVIAAVVLSSISTVAGLAILASSLDLQLPDSWGFRGFPAIFALTFTWTGANLAWRRPRNAVGWLLLWVGTIAGTQVFVTEYSIVGVIGRDEPLAGAVFAGWITSWVWLTEVTAIAVFLLQLFPDGRFVSRRWRAVAWFGTLSAFVGAFILAFNAGPLNNAPHINNPYPLFDDPGSRSFYFVMGGVALAGIGSAASLFVRYRRARGVERQQLKWLAFEAIVIAIAVVVGSFYQSEKWPAIFLISAMALAPVMVGIAVFRYRLYEIDAVINRALVYGATTALIALAFFAGIVVLQTLLRPFTSGSEIAVAVSTLVSVALAQPLRGRMQGVVDRRFYRSRYDAVRTLDTFSDKLREVVDLDAVRADLLRAVGDTVQPEHAGLWLREPTR